MCPQSTTGCSNCPVLCDTVFEGAPADTLAGIGEDRDLRSFLAGEMIFREAAPVTGVYCICSGAVILRKQDQLGADHDVARMGPGALIGFRNPSGHGDYCVTAVADTTVTACHIPIDRMVDLARRNPSILLRLAQSFCHRIEELRNRAA